MAPINKLEEQIRVCIEFRDLNVAFPKDDFPLPNIDTLVENPTGYEMLSLMDGFLVIIRFRLLLRINTKLTSLPHWGIFCYKVMAFDLNIDATYQCTITYFFHDMMYDVVEDYVDDLLSKSNTRYQHWDIFKKVFAYLLKHNIRLNPKKYVFR